jgi:hypothetical protein
LPAVKPLDRVARKWIERASVAGPEYEAGVSSPKVPWDQAAAAAEGNWAQQLQAAIGEKRFSAGVRARGLAFWQNRAKLKGPTRFAEGVRIAEPEYRTRWGAIRGIIEGTTLPPRKPKGQNIDRVDAMVKALIAGRLRGKAGR